MRCCGALRRSSLAERALVEALLASVGGAGEVEPGPRAADLTLRLGNPSDLLAAAAVLLSKHAMAFATVVATDETATPSGDMKVRYVFEPAAPGAGVAAIPADRFVTLLVGVDPACPEVPSLAMAIPAANWHEREMQDLFGIVPVGHPDPRPLVVHDGWPPGVFPLRKSFDASQRLPVLAADEFPHLVAEGAMYLHASGRGPGSWLRRLKRVRLGRRGRFEVIHVDRDPDRATDRRWMN